MSPRVNSPVVPVTDEERAAWAEAAEYDVVATVGGKDVRYLRGASVEEAERTLEVALRRHDSARIVRRRLGLETVVMEVTKMAEKGICGVCGGEKWLPARGRCGKCDRAAQLEAAAQGEPPAKRRRAPKTQAQEGAFSPVFPAEWGVVNGNGTEPEQLAAGVDGEKTFPALRLVFRGERDAALFQRLMERAEKDRRFADQQALQLLEEALS